MREKLALGCLTVALALGPAVEVSAEEKKVIAVGEPNTRWARTKACRGYAPNYAATIADSMRTRIAQSGAFGVVSRAQMAKILKEHERSMLGLIDPNKAKLLGRFLQADYLMGVDLLCHPNHVEMNINLVDVETTRIVWAKTYEMRDLGKTRRALKDIAKLMKKFATSGSVGDSAGRGEGFQLVDSKAFHDAADYIVDRIRHTIPRAHGTVEEVNVYAESIKVNIRYSGYQPWAGLKLKVTRDDEELGWVFLKKKGRRIVEAGTNDEMSAFEEGDQVSSEEFEPTVAVGFIEDVDEGMDEMVDWFKERMAEVMQAADGVVPAEGRKVKKILQRMGRKAHKKDLEKLHKAGVDLLIVGRFLGENLKRRLDFEVLSTYDGKKVIDIKRDRIGL